MIQDQIGMQMQYALMPMPVTGQCHDILLCQSKRKEMMDNNKAKKAVELAMMAKLMADASPINPEIQAMAPAMQPADGLINPYAQSALCLQICTVLAT